MWKHIPGVLCLLLGLAAEGQAAWQKCSCNPVMVKDSSFYEGLAIGSPSVLIDSGRFKMLYAAGGLDHKGRIAYAYSSDGVHWTKYRNGTPVFEPDTGNAWDSHFLDTPEWLKDSTGYKMYYFGDTDNDPRHSAIGMATSVDGVHWQRSAANPVLTPGNPGDWDALYIESPAVVFDGTTYFMYFSGVSADYRVRIGLATSSDGIHWTKYPANPVLTEGGLLDWDGFSVGTPTVRFHNGRFEMWYCGVSNFDLLDNKVDTIKVGYAYSYDGIHWTKDTANPILHTYSSPYTPFDQRGPWAPTVVYDDGAGAYRMWYETAHGFGMAEGTPNTPSGRGAKDFPGPLSITVEDGALHIQTAIPGRLTIRNAVGRVMMRNVPITTGVHTIHHQLPQGTYLLTFAVKEGSCLVTQRIYIQ